MTYQTGDSPDLERYLISDEELKAIDRRKNASDTLRKLSKDMSTDYSHSQSQEDLEDSRYFDAMATKNDNGTLTIKEAQNLLYLLEAESPVIIDTEGKRWIEIG